MDFAKTFGAVQELMKNEYGPFTANYFDGFGYSTSFFVVHKNIILYFVILLYIMKHANYDCLVVERKKYVKTEYFSGIRKYARWTYGCACGELVARNDGEEE